MASAVLTVACVVLWFFWFRPQALGGPAGYIGVDGTSMTPTMHAGDLAVVQKQSSYHVGEVIAYTVPAGEPGAGLNVIHRIVGGNGVTGFVTEGDHNAYTDHYWHPTTADVIGAVWFHVPKGAVVLSKLHDPLFLALLVAALAFVVIAWPTKKQLDRAHAPPPEADLPPASAGTGGEATEDLVSVQAGWEVVPGVHRGLGER